jgi:thiamine pyrophosphokinase
LARENPTVGGDNHDLYMTSHPPPLSATGKKAQLDILVLGGLGGRVDQGFSQVHHLYAAYEEKRQSTTSQAGDLYLLSEESLSFILPPGKNVIHTPFTHQQRPEHHQEEKDKGKEVFSENVGIIPLSGPTLISLKGFEWDVTKWRTEIGGQLSTSNHIRADKLEVDVDVDLGRAVLFTVELGDRFKRLVNS